MKKFYEKLLLLVLTDNSRKNVYKATDIQSNQQYIIYFLKNILDKEELVKIIQGAIDLIQNAQMQQNKNK